MIRNIVLSLSMAAILWLPQTLNAQNEWAQVKIAVGSVREEKGYPAEMGTQAIMGTPVKILGHDDGWYNVETPDGYHGWIFSGSLALKSPEELAQWRKGQRLVVTNPYQIHIYESAESESPREVVTDLVTSSIVEGSLDNPINGKVLVTLPDGRKGWGYANEFATIEDWAAQDFDAESILNEAYSLMGSSYLWGGMSPKAMDCSGLVRVCYMTNGYILMRNASQQALTGTYMSADQWQDYQPGDLVFFGNDKGRITHVALYDKDGYIVHCAGRVRKNHLDASHPDYVERKVASAARIHGNEGSRGITQVRNHPWYF